MPESYTETVTSVVNAPDAPAGSSRGLHNDADRTVREIVRSYGNDRTRLMDIVLTIQRRLGHIGPATVQLIAAELGIHAVEIDDMVSFYAFLRRRPGGRVAVHLSNTPISRIKGAAAIAAAFEAELGIAMGGTTTDGAFSLDWTSDIGMCDQEPAALVGDIVLTSLKPDDVASIVAALRAGPAVPPDLGRFGVGCSLVGPGPVLFAAGQAGAGVTAALALAPDAVVELITRSKLRGRGGAGFPTGMKWRLCRQAISDAHHVVCNADEGEPGTFKDRVLLTECPDLVFDGMTIAGYALGARNGLLYLRYEYAYLLPSLHAVLERRRSDGRLGTAIHGRPGFDFDIRIQLGAGAYICGEESALLESLEGKRGVPRDRPPFPTERGYLHQPTAIDNVETFACAARILERGPAFFTGFGTHQSTGTKLMSVSGDCARPGVYEVPFGITLNALLDLVGAPDAAFVQVGGASGQSVAPKDFGRSLCYEDLSTGGSIMVFGPERDVLDIVLQFTGFFVDESCGWCTPCRVGTTLLKRDVGKIIAGRGTLSDIAGLQTLGQTISRMSRCGLGQSAANPILNTLRDFPELYEARLRDDDFLPRFTMREALQDAVQAQGRQPVTSEEAS